MLNIGSIKKQKNNIESIELCGELIQKGYNVELHIAGGIQDKEEYNRCLDLINDLRMNDIVFFHGVLSQQDLSVLISNCDINLSTSLWETFGRGIFEGMAGGLPTVIYSRIACVQEYVKHGDGILFAENRADFLDILERIITDYEYYCDLSKKAALSASAFSSKNESLKLVNAILNKCVLIVFGTRPEFIKIYPLIVEFNRRGLKYHLLCTNQHQNIAKDIMELHNIKPEYLIDINRDDDIEKYKLKLVDAIARCIIDNSYDGVVVQGDTLSTLCGALAAYKTKTKLFHVEAGMRTYDLENPYPEEGYRIKISSMADYHFCPSYIEENNLINEGYSNIFVTGNTFVDYRKDNKKETTVSNCVLVTIHRRENLPCINKMVCEIKQLANYHTELEFFIPVHPNPLLVDAFSILSSIRNIIITNPLGPDEFYSKLLSSSIVISDSGGVQEECLIARKKLLVVRKSTERVIDYDYVKQIDPYKESMIDAFNMLLNKNCSSPACSLYGDGTASKNITEIIMEAI